MLQSRASRDRHPCTVSVRHTFQMENEIQLTKDFSGSVMEKSRSNKLLVGGPGVTSFYFSNLLGLSFPQHREKQASETHTLLDHLCVLAGFFTERRADTKKKKARISRLPILLPIPVPSSRKRVGKSRPISRETEDIFDNTQIFAKIK